MGKHEVCPYNPMTFLIRIILRIAINLISLLAADYFINDVTIDGAYPAMLAALALSVINVTVRPILRLIALPVTIITLGLFIFVINGAMLLLVAWLVPGLEVLGLLAAIEGALIISVASWVLEVLLMPKKT